jgi:hypothetical protein
MPDTTAIRSSAPSPDDLVVSTLTIRPWIDAVVDDDGYDPRSRYVEIYWLGVLGPTATWLIRRLVAGLDQSPQGYELDLVQTARSMGLGYSAGRSSPFARALQRCVMFGVAHPIDRGLAVRRRIPAISQRHLQRMPTELQAAHADWQQASVGLDELTRAHALATAMVHSGDDLAVIEHQLLALGVRGAVAAQAADNAFRLATPSP